MKTLILIGLTGMYSGVHEYYKQLYKLYKDNSDIDFGIVKGIGGRGNPFYDFENVKHIAISCNKDIKLLNSLYDKIHIISLTDNVMKEKFELLKEQFDGQIVLTIHGINGTELKVLEYLKDKEFFDIHIVTNSDVNKKYIEEQGLSCSNNGLPYKLIAVRREEKRRMHSKYTNCLSKKYKAYNKQYNKQYSALYSKST